MSIARAACLLVAALGAVGACGGGAGRPPVPEPAPAPAPVPCTLGDYGADVCGAVRAILDDADHDFAHLACAGSAVDDAGAASIEVGGLRCRTHLNDKRAWIECTGGPHDTANAMMTCARGRLSQVKGRWLLHRPSDDAEVTCEVDAIEPSSNPDEAPRAPFDCTVHLGTAKD